MQFKYLGTGAECSRKIFERNSNIHAMMPLKLYLEESQEPGIAVYNHISHTKKLNMKNNIEKDCTFSHRKRSFELPIISIEREHV